MSTALTTLSDRAALTPAEYFTARGETARFLDLTRERDRNLVQSKVSAMLYIERLLREGLTRQKSIAQAADSFCGNGRGFSAAKLTKDFQLWSRGGQKPNARGKREGKYFPARDWRVFKPEYSNGDVRAALSNKPFIARVRRMDADSVRDDVNGEALHQRLLDAWYDGEEVEGYGNIFRHCAERGLPVPAPTDVRRKAFYPSGWSGDNLNRILRSFAAERAYTRRGEHAAHSHWGLQLLRDRSRLMPLQLITFDDVHFDIAVIWHVPGQQPQVVRPKAIFALDVATGCILSYGILGAYTRTTDTDGGAKGARRGLQQGDLRFLMCSLLERFGLPRDWQMSFLLEHGSASLGAVDERIFRELTGSRFDHTGLVRGTLTTSDFVEQGGMPWQKGWIESWFRLLHMRTNHLPGSFGPNYTIMRGNQAKAADYAIKTACAALDQGLTLDEVKLPLLTLPQFEELIAEYVARLNMRTTHSLQGFERVYEVEATRGTYYRTDDPRAVPYISEGTPLHPRMESPAERLMRLARGHRFDAVHPRVLATLSMDKHVITLNADRVRLSVPRISNDKLEFFDETSIAALRKYRGIDKGALAFTSTDGALCHLFTSDADMTFIATLRNNERVDLADQHAILARAGEVHQSRQHIRDNVAELLGPREEYLSNMREHNARVLGQETHPVADRIASESNRATRRQRTEDDMEQIQHDYFADVTREDEPGDLEQINADILTDL